MAQWIGPATILLNLSVLILTCWLCYLLIKKLIPGFVKIQVKKSRSTEDSVLIKKRPFAPLAHLGPGLLIYHLAPVFFNIDTRFLSVFQQPGGNDIEKSLPAQA